LAEAAPRAAAALPQEAAPAAARTVKLRLVTYNIHKGVGTDRRLRLDRIVDVVSHYDPHVVCLQEVTWAKAARGRRTQPQALAAAIGLPHGVVGINCRRWRCVYGNMTLSKYPIEHHENLDLTVTFRKSRGALYTRIRLPHAPLHVFNAHLGLSGYERIMQMRELVADTPRLATGREAIVYAGDMNDWRHRLFSDVLAPAGYRPAAGDRDDPGHSTYPSALPIVALDKVFVHGAVKAARATPSRLALARVASDHLPVVAELEVDPR
jgi:endonuclease/exonuclease/phosphatase family metal-dependent hydrolase